MFQCFYNGQNRLTQFNLTDKQTWISKQETIVFPDIKPQRQHNVNNRGPKMTPCGMPQVEGVKDIYFTMMKKSL